METNYKEEYDKFMSEYKKGITDGEDVGAMVARMAQHFADYNSRVGQLEIVFNEKAAEIERSSDPESAKPISSAKAGVMSKATSEYGRYLLMKKDLENIEQFINSLKSLQRGILNEYAHSSLL